MYTSNAQTVIDNETKFRGGIRIGNFAEEILAADYSNEIDKQNQIQMGGSMAKGLHSLGNTVHNVKKEVKTTAQKDFEEIAQFNCRGEKSHILFGHGINNQTNSEFNKREFRTNNEMAYNMKIKPQDFQSSKFHPQQYGGRESMTFTSNNFKRTGESVLEEPKKYREYGQFIKTFDGPIKRLGLRK